MRLTDRDDGRRQIALRGRDAVEIDLRAHPAGRAQLGAAADEAAGAQILEAGDDLGRAQLGKDAVRRAHQHVFEKRVGDLDRALVGFGVGFVERSDENDAPPNPLRSVAFPISTMS